MPDPKLTASVKSAPLAAQRSNDLKAEKGVFITYEK
jgi:hypothetical protein